MAVPSLVKETSGGALRMHFTNLCCSLCPECSQNVSYFSSFCFSPLPAPWFTNTVQTLCTTTAATCLLLACPGYLTEFKIYKPTRQVGVSSNTPILCLPSVRTHLLGQRSFSYAVTSISSSLHCKVRSSDKLRFFRSSLKSHLLKLSYWLHAWCLCACKSLFWLSFGSLLWNGLCATVWRNGT